MLRLFAAAARSQCKSGVPVSLPSRSSYVSKVTNRFISRRSNKIPSPEERAALRAARKERASRVLQQGDAGAAAVDASGAATTSAAPRVSTVTSRWVWYMIMGVPSVVITWAIADDQSPPAKVAEFIGLTAFIRSYTDEIAKPSHEKLIADWSQLPNVPQNVPVPPTLVLDLEQTLVCSTWDRKYGWRHAKRPGVDKFLREMAQYYEIILYSPTSFDLAEPIVNSLDKSGAIMHRLYRDATYYTNGVHVKDLSRLNRNMKRIVVLDDDPAEVQFHPDHLIRVKPYTDPTDRSDRTLENITPFLIELAREGYKDFPFLLRQYQGLDADEIALEQERRIQVVKKQRDETGLRRFAFGQPAHLVTPTAPPELDPEAASAANSSAAPTQLTARDIVGSAPQSAGAENAGGVVKWIHRRAQEKEEDQRRKMERWNEMMMKKQMAKQEAEKQKQQQKS